MKILSSLGAERSRIKSCVAERYMHTVDSTVDRDRAKVDRSARRYVPTITFRSRSCLPRPVPSPPSVTTTSRRRDRDRAGN